MLVGKIGKVTLMSHIAEGLDYCTIMVGFDELAYFGDYNEALGYIGESVLYDIMPDIYQNVRITRIANLTREKVVHTVDKAERVKLIPAEAATRVVCTFAVDTFRKGDYENNCIALMCEYERNASAKATWVDIKMIDKNAKHFNLRFFTNNVEDGVDPYIILDGLVGHYVKFNANNTRYGIQTDALEAIQVPVVAPPEVDIAISQIQSFVKEDAALSSYMEQYNYVDILKGQIYGEPGYHLVELASELYEVEALQNISYEYDMPLLVRAAVTSRGYLLPSKAKYSKALLNTNKVLRSELREDRELLLILDVLAEEDPTNNKLAFYRIKDNCRKILNERRGVYEEDISGKLHAAIKYI